MKHLFAATLSRILLRHTVAIACALVLLTGFSWWRAQRLRINNNQIELIPQDLPSVVATKQMIDITGGVGFLLLPIRSQSLEHAKKIADVLGPQLEALPEVRTVTYKQDVDFVRDRMGLFVETEDLKEGYKRIKRHVRGILRKYNPIADLGLAPPPDENLHLDDLLDKYRRFNKKAIDDPYYVDDRKEVVLCVIKPDGNATDLAFTRKLMQQVEGVVKRFNATNTLGAHLVEEYHGKWPEGATATYGYTGTYKTNLDDSDNMNKALLPTASIAFAGMLVYLLIYMRRPMQIALIMAVMMLGVLVSYAFCELVIGELNTITAILASVLMGLGIDYGIHFTFRLREEYTLKHDLKQAIGLAIEHSGTASFISALTTAAVFCLLLISDFKGFSHFGVVTGIGVLATALLMYVALPVAYLLIDRVWPSFKNGLLLKKTTDAEQKAYASKPYPYARSILAGGVLLTLLLGAYALRITFDYDSRTLMSSDRPSILLQDEINRRYKISSDPVAVYTETKEETEELYEYLTPVSEHSSIDAVASIFTLAPPMEKQLANKVILDKLHNDLSQITPDMLEPSERVHFDALLKQLEAQPFTSNDLPDYIQAQFRPVPGSAYKGYVTFIYPKTAMWNGEDLLRFADEVDHFTLEDKTYYSAGMPVLYAKLARMVMRDGKIVTLCAALVIALFLVWNFRSVRGAACAMLPLAAGLVWMLGVMALTGWKINFMNIVVFPLVLGDGVSCGIHLYHRFREDQSVVLAVKHTGSAVVASFMTTIIGWGALLFSGHKGLASMGILACFGIAGALAVSMTLLPALLQFWQDWSARKAQENISA